MAKTLTECAELQCTPKPTIRPPWFRCRVPFVPQGETMTQQAAFDQTDVNQIVARFHRDGYMPTNNRTPQYGDVTQLQGDLTQKLCEAEAIIKTAAEFAEKWSPPEPDTPPAADTPPPQEQP